MQTAEENLLALTALRTEITSDQFITAFDNYQQRIDDLGSDAVVGGLANSVAALNSYRTDARNAYIDYLGTLNREVGQAQDALDFGQGTPITLKIINSY